jgi:hypothetical protein
LLNLKEATCYTPFLKSATLRFESPQRAELDFIGTHMPFRWKTEYDKLASVFLEQHFAGGKSLTYTFPCMREEYPWGSHRPAVMDSRVPAKNNTEYHGLERYASQYHVTAQYEFAYHHWLMAAYWRQADAKANNFSDAGHERALEYCVKQAQYNKNLAEWQKNLPRFRPALTPEEFGLRRSDIEAKDKLAAKEMDSARSKQRKT